MKNQYTLQPTAFSIFGLICIFAVLAGCAVGPDYKSPTALSTNSLPTKFGDTAITNYGEWKPAQPAASIPRGEWWKLFGDAELNRLETLAASNNQQIAVAIGNFEQARAVLREEQSVLFPQITGSGSLNRQRTSANNSPSINNNNNVNNGRTYNTFKVSADASWEIDLWGRVRRLTESARAQLAASADDLESVKLSIQAEVAKDYFTLRAQDAQSESLTKTADAYQHALELTQNRKKSGIADDLDVAQAETQLRGARAQIPATDLQRAQTRHALAVLCGQSPTTFALAPGSVESLSIPEIPSAIPSELLEHRPDIAAAERRMAVANANVGIAAAAFYPKLLLNASGGFQSVNSSTLFDWPSHLWSIGPTLEVPLFNGGFNRAQLRAQKAAYAVAVGNYRQTVLTAFQDVEDQLAAQRLQGIQLEQETLALASAKRTLEIANNRYKAGVEQYLDVITAQTTALGHEQTVIQLQGNRLASTVTFIKSIGAGWTNAAGGK